MKVPPLRSAPVRTAAVAAFLGLWSAFWAWQSWPVSGLSWHFSADGSRWLFGSSGLHLYADHPELQTGPLSLVVAGLGRLLPAATAKTVALVLMAAAGPVLLAVLAPLVPAERRHRRILAAGLLLIPAWAVLAVRWGHLDDVLAMAAAVLAIRALVAGRSLLTGLALGAAIAAKPWAIGFVPLVLALPQAPLLAAIVAASVTAASWLPFVLADPNTLTALHPPVGLTDSSGLHTLGARGRVVPSWARTAQLLLAPAAALAVTLARRWPGVLLVAVAVRLALDPQDNGYYIGSAALAAVVFDLLGTTWTVPWTTLATVVGLWQPFVSDYAHRMSTTTGLTHAWFAHPSAVGAIHLGWALAMLLTVALAPPVHRVGRDRMTAPAGPQ